MQKIVGGTFNVVKDNIEKIKEIFPEVFVDNKVDLDKLRIALGEHVEKEKERYEFTWNGKTEAIQLAQKQTTGTLRPCKENSVDWDHTQNLYVEGDNLEVLRVLQNSYRNKVKVIYIDPPYNTGSDFIYKDDFRDNVKNYTKKMNENMKSNADTSGRYHTDWLNMMYPRLKIARNLLTEDGAIFISIDEREQSNLKKICDEIFGEENFIETFLWTKTSTPPSLAMKSRKTVEYILCYEKNRNSTKYRGEPLDNGDAPLLNSGNPLQILEFPAGSIQFRIQDGTYKVGKYEKIELVDELIVENGLNQNKVRLKGEFKWVQETLNKEIAGGTYFLIKSDKFSIRFQRAVKEDSYKTPTNFITKKQMEVELNAERGIGTNESASKELSLLKMKDHFDYPKPLGLIKYLINTIANKDDLIMDFFAGSATTAHAVLSLNSEDNGSRKFIMVQIGEEIDQNTVAYKEGFNTITEISMERIRRAGNHILSEAKKKNGASNFDHGFKVFKLDETNLKLWDEESSNVEQMTIDMIDPIKADRSHEDVVFEILLKYGIDLTTPVEEVMVDGKRVFSIGLGFLLVCLERDLTVVHIEEMAKLQPSRIVFSDEGFKDDTVRANGQQILKRYGVDDVRVI